MKTFKTLKIQDKVFIHNTAVFIHDIKTYNGYLKIWYQYERNNSQFNYYPSIYIPLNHLNANKLKVGNTWIFLTDKGYKNICNFLLKKNLTNNGKY